MATKKNRKTYDYFKDHTVNNTEAAKRENKEDLYNDNYNAQKENPDYKTGGLPGDKDGKNYMSSMIKKGREREQERLAEPIREAEAGRYIKGGVSPKKKKGDK